MPTATESGARLAVLGSPIAHSKSPVLHAAAYRVLDLDWRYEAAQVDSDGLPAFVASRDLDWRGLSLTMPLKYAAIPLVDSLDGVARLTGAANTILFDLDATGARVLRGFNTDVPGIVRALAAAGVVTARHVHILGGGATAASAVVAAAELGAEHVSVGVRTPSRGRLLAELARSIGLTLSIDAFDREPPAVPDLVVSTLPGTIDREDAHRLLGRRAIAAAIDTGAAFLDVAYDPWPTPAVRTWLDAVGRDAAGGVVLSGLPMLVHQALLQVRIFVGGDPTLPLDRDADVLAAMLGAVGLDAAGRPDQDRRGGGTAVPVPES